MGFGKNLIKSGNIFKGKHGPKGSFHVSFEMFFDRPGVGERLIKKEETILARTGHFTMNAVRWSMRPAAPSIDKKKSALRKRKKFHAARMIGAGKPPRRRWGDLRDKTYFGLEPNGYSVVIGPLAYSGGALTTPELLQYGGRRTIKTRKGKNVQGLWLPRPFAADSKAFDDGFEEFQRLQEEIPL